MDRESVKDLLRQVLGGGVEMEDRGSWVSTHCPIARWEHEKGTDRNMSFGVSVDPDGPSGFHCFACKSKGPLPYLLRLLERYRGDDYGALRRTLEQDEDLIASVPTWEGREARTARRATLGAPLSADYLDLYDPAFNHPYVQARGVDPQIAEDLDLRVDPDNHGEERILFPVHAFNGNFYGYTGRATRNGAEPRVRDYFGLPKKLLLLGADLVDPERDRYVVLVEGPFDMARVFQAGHPVVAALHSDLTPEQAAILIEINLPVYVMLDNDKAGAEGAKQVKSVLGRHLPLMKVRYPGRAKDPGMLSEAQINKTLSDARLL